MKSFFRSLFSSSVNAIVFALIFAGILGSVAYTFAALDSVDRAERNSPPLLDQLFDNFSPDTLQFSTRDNPNDRIAVIGANLQWENGGFVRPVSNEKGAAIVIHRGGNMIQVVSSKDTVSKGDAIIGLDGGNSYFNPSGGNFGIGTANPETKLTVEGQNTEKIEGTGTITIQTITSPGGSMSIEGSGTNFTSLEVGYTIYGIYSGQNRNMGTVTSISDNTHLIVSAGSGATNVTNADWQYSTNLVASFEGGNVSIDGNLNIDGDLTVNGTTTTTTSGDVTGGCTNEYSSQGESDLDITDCFSEWGLGKCPSRPNECECPTGTTIRPDPQLVSDIAGYVPFLCIRD